MGLFNLNGGRSSVRSSSLAKHVSKCALVGLTAAAFGATQLAQAAVPKLSVDGNRIVADGQTKELVGLSLFWSNNSWGGAKYYNAGAVKGIKDFFGGNLVRAAMGAEDGGGYIEDAGNNVSRVRTVVDAAIANDMYVIIDWHSHEAENNESQAIDFFEDMANLYGDTNNVIYEIYNEPENVNGQQKSWPDVIKPYSQRVINAIRAIDSDNLIIVGNPTWDQFPNIAAADPVSGSNITYTLHFYAGTHGQSVRNNAIDALDDHNASVFVSEWGTVNANGNGGVDTSSTNEWVDFMKARKLSHANWALNDKNEGASILKSGASTTGNWTTSDLTPSGQYIYDLIQSYNLNGGGSSSSSSSGGSSSGSSSSGSTGYTSRVNLPGRIQAENYYQAPVESSPGNQNSGSTSGCTYRGLSVDVQNASEGTCNVGWTTSGEQLTYRAGSAGGTYNIAVRHASTSSGKRIRVAVNGSTVGTVSSTGGGWQTWKTTTISNVSIPTNATITVTFLDGSVNLNYLNITTASSSSSSSSGGSSSSGASSSSGGSGSCQNVAFRATVELDLRNGNCVDFSRSLSGEVLQVKDSDTNRSCDFRGSVTDGSRSTSITRNYVKVENMQGSRVTFNASNSCNFVLIKTY